MYRQIYSIFYISLLELYRVREDCKPPKLIEIYNKEEWKVDYILNIERL
jgi:hypothetical protein